MSVVVKVILNDEIRRVSLELTEGSFGRFRAAIIASFPALRSVSFSLKYFDDEKDAISIFSDSELVEAIRMYQPASVRVLVHVAGEPVDPFQVMRAQGHCPTPKSWAPLKEEAVEIKVLQPVVSEPTPLTKEEEVVAAAAAPAVPSPSVPEEEHAPKQKDEVKKDDDAPAPTPEPAADDDDDEAEQSVAPEVAMAALTALTLDSGFVARLPALVSQGIDILISGRALDDVQAGIDALLVASAEGLHGAALDAHRTLTRVHKHFAPHVAQAVLQAATMAPVLAMMKPQILAMIPTIMQSLPAYLLELMEHCSQTPCSGKGADADAQANAECSNKPKVDVMCIDLQSLFKGGNVANDLEGMLQNASGLCENMGLNLSDFDIEAYATAPGQPDVKVPLPVPASACQREKSNKKHGGDCRRDKAAKTPKWTEQAKSGAYCDSCSGAIAGVRFICTVCEDFDLCDECEALDEHPTDHPLVKLAQPIMPSAAVHHGVACDVCEQAPILGDRFKCTVCRNYDMCSTCEAKAVHDPTHPLAKFKVPAKNMSAAREPCFRRRGGGFGGRFGGHGHHGRPHHGPHHGPPHHGPPHHGPPHHGPHHGPHGPGVLGGARRGGWRERWGVEPRGHTSTGGVPKKHCSQEKQQQENSPSEERLRVRFLKDLTLPDNAVVAPSEVLVKEWRLLNIGAPFPEDTKLIFLRGDREIVAQEEFDMPSVTSRGPFVASAVLVTPTKPGSYNAYFRLAHGERNLFGPRIWANIQVDDLKGEAASAVRDTEVKETKVPSEESEEDGVKVSGPALVVAAPVEQEQEKRPARVETPVVVAQPVIVPDPAVIAESMREDSKQAESQRQAKWAPALQHLREIGFDGDDEFLITMLTNHDGDITQTCLYLLQQRKMLSSSQ